MAKIELKDTTGSAGATARKIALKAIEQYNKYNGLDEGSPKLSQQIKKYWQENGFDFPGVETAWSAVFVSWCITKSGLTRDQFKPDSNHSLFVHDILHNKRAYTVYKVDEYAPRIGDVIHHNREGGKKTLEDMAMTSGFKSFASHSAIVVQKGEDAQGKFVVTVGGNESDTVGKKRWALKSNGTLIQRLKNPIICVMRLTI